MHELVMNGNMIEVLLSIQTLVMTSDVVSIIGFLSVLQSH